MAKPVCRIFLKLMLKVIYHLDPTFLKRIRILEKLVFVIL
jgi:transcription initiation factor IIF auxiliary subunit